MKQTLRLLTLFTVIFVTHAFSAEEEAIVVTGTASKRAVVAIGQVYPKGEVREDETALEINKLLQVDLSFTTFFEIAPKSAFTAVDLPGEIAPNHFDALSAAGISFFLKATYKIEGGKLVLEASFYDVFAKKRVLGNRYQYAVNQFSKVVHTLVEDITKLLTGEKGGLFLSRLAMVCWKKGITAPNKEIYLIDPDGRNLKQITFDKTLSLSPAWAPDGKSLTYTQFEWRRVGRFKKKMTVLKRHNLLTGNRYVISAQEGMNSGSTWMPNGRKIAATLSFSGRPEIYLMDPIAEAKPEPFSRKILWRKIAGEGFQNASLSLLFDVEPSFSPEGKRMVISSARTGHPMIYVIDMESKIANQLTFAGQYNASPAWSPKGDKIIFAAQRTGEGNFDLYAIDPDGNNLARLTNGERGFRRVNSENPAWAPAGRHIAYSNNDGGSYGIYIMSIDGKERRKISPSDLECKTPAWSPSER